jgi:hypothetical protein
VRPAEETALVIEVAEAEPLVAGFRAAFGVTLLVERSSRGPRFPLAARLA